MTNSTLDARTVIEAAAEHTDFSAGIQAALLEFAEEINELGITIKPLPAHLFERGWWGAYDHDSRSIYLWPTLAFFQARSVLSHELAHAHFGHTGQVEEQEEQARSHSSDKLISLKALRSTVLGIDIGGAIGEALGIIPRDLKQFADDHPAEVAEILLEACRKAGFGKREDPGRYRKNHQPMMYDRIHTPQHEAQDATV